jgi:hypothetical protein
MLWVMESWLTQLTCNRMLFINKKNLIKLKQSIEVLATTWMNFENIISERNISHE